MTTTTHPLPVSETEKRQFLANGFIRLNNVIPEDELNWYRARYDSLFDDPSKIKQLAGKDEQGRAALPQILAPSKAMPEFLEQPYLSRLEAIAKFILGPEAKFRNDHMILKPAGHGAPTPWHQDQAYHTPDTYTTSINFWLPLEGATVAGGTMQYVRHSHRGTMLPHRYLIPGDSQSALVADNQDYWMENADALDCPAGSVLLHHSYCLHYAGPNRTNVPRRAYIAVFATPARPLDRPFHLPWQGNPYWPEEAPAQS